MRDRAGAVAAAEADAAATGVAAGAAEEAAAGVEGEGTERNRSRPGTQVSSSTCLTSFWNSWPLTSHLQGKGLESLSFHLMGSHETRREHRID